MVIHCKKALKQNVEAPHPWAWGITFQPSHPSFTAIPTRKSPLGLQSKTRNTNYLDIFSSETKQYYQYKFFKARCSTGAHFVCSYILNYR